MNEDDDWPRPAYETKALERIMRVHLAPKGDVARAFALRRIEEIGTGYLFTVDDGPDRGAPEKSMRERVRVAERLLELMRSGEDAADVGDPDTLERVRSELEELRREWALALEDLPPTKRGPKEKLARLEFVKALDALWGEFHGPARRQQDKTTDEETGPFLAFSVACLYPIDPAACTGLGDVVREVCGGRKRRAVG